jgi:hypothetical protein
MWLAVPHVTEKVQDKIVEEYVELYLMLRPAYLATFFQAPTHLGVEGNATTARSANIKPCNTAGCCNIAAQSLAFAIAFRSLASMQVSISFFKAVFLFCKNSIAFVSHIIVPSSYRFACSFFPSHCWMWILPIRRQPVATKAYLYWEFEFASLLIGPTTCGRGIW